MKEKEESEIKKKQFIQIISYTLCFVIVLIVINSIFNYFISSNMLIFFLQSHF